jgi:hypothetical protein
MAWFTSKPKGNGIVEMAVELPVTFMQEGDNVIVYTPSLDLSSYGSNKGEALNMFNEVVRIFFNDLVENNTLDEVLPGLGWTKTGTHDSWVPPNVSQESIRVRIPVAA